MSVKVRELALLSLLRCDADQRYSNLELNATIRKHGLQGADRGLYTLLVYGVTEKSLILDYYLSLFSKIPPEKMEPAVLAILRLGLYQILYCDRIPDAAAVSESVELCKSHSHRGTEGFVNGVLRALLRQKEKCVPPLPGTVPEEVRLSLVYGIPAPICALWLEQYGANKTETLLSALDRHPPVTLRVNPLKIRRDALMQALRDDGFACEPTAASPVGIRLTDPVPMTDFAPLSEGLCFVQDEASQLCVRTVNAQPGETVIDTCACPGGKSFGLAMDMENRGQLISMDLHQNKLSLVEKGARAAGISILSTRCHNGTSPLEALAQTADRVLCDVPCSGLGVLAKKPDLRYKNMEDIRHLPEVQYAILSAGASYVKPGGTLVYSTCTLNRRENDEVVQRFSEEWGDRFAPSPFTLLPDDTPAPVRTLFPDECGSDGFFVARFVRKP